LIKKGEDNIENNGCCCGNGSEVNDQSRIKNPENPRKEIEKEFIKYLENLARDLDITAMGYAKIPDHVFEKNESLKYSNAIVFLMPIGMDIINADPSSETKKLNDKL
jgi:hypothetical protein